MRGLPPTFILFDSEYTAWPGSQERRWSAAGEHREIIQIAAIKVDNTELRETGHFVRYVKPRISPALSAYFVDLTGITQETVDDRGVDVATALREFKEWCGEIPIYSFGRDGEVVLENCTLAHIPCPFTVAQFNNIRRFFSEHGIDAGQYNSWNIVAAFDILPTRHAHNALDDVRTVLDALVCLSKQTRDWSLSAQQAA